MSKSIIASYPFFFNLLPKNTDRCRFLTTAIDAYFFYLENNYSFTQSLEERIENQLHSSYSNPDDQIIWAEVIQLIHTETFDYHLFYWLENFIIDFGIIQGNVLFYGFNLNSFVINFKR